MSDMEWLDSPRPLGVWGTSGAGKTTFLRWVHDQRPSVFFNPDHEPDMGRQVRNVPELREALMDGADRIDVRIPETKTEDPELHEEVVTFLLRVGNRLRESDDVSGTELQFITDECHTTGDSLVTAAKRFRKRHIKPIMSTQEPASTSKRARSVNHYHAWLSAPPRPMYGWIKRESDFPLEKLKDLPDYDALIMDAQHVPTDRVRAPESYARD